MVCSSGVGFDSELDGEALNFKLSGIYNGVMVMSDGKTDTVWSHLTGEALHGKHAGRQLGVVPTYSVKWGAWKARHPETTVLALDERYGKFYSPSGLGRKGLGKGRSGNGDRLEPMFKQTLTREMDARLPGKTLVLGVAAGDEARAYPLQALPKALQDELGGVPLVVFKDGGGAMAFDRRLEGKALSFEGMKDKETDSSWNAEGRCLEGELKGKALLPVFAIVTEWYGWSYFKPGTGIREAPEKEKE